MSSTHPRPAFRASTVSLAAAILALLGVIGGLTLAGGSHSAKLATAPGGTGGLGATQVVGNPISDEVNKLIFEGLSRKLSEWATQPGCDSVDISLSPADILNRASAYKDGLKDVWNILKSKCSADSGGFPEFLQVLPNGMIARDPEHGTAYLITGGGWLWIPTGGDYLCFTGQGHPVQNFPGLDGYTEGFAAGKAKCVPDQPTAVAPLPAAPVPPAPAQPAAPAKPPVTVVISAPAPAPAQPPVVTHPAAAPLPAPGPAQPSTWTETAGAVAHTWTNPANAGGYEGPTIPAYTAVQISCYTDGMAVADGDTAWYLVASSPWNGQYWVSGDVFYNNGQTSGSLHGTPFRDPAIRHC